jgi:hypothetical protein
LLKLDFTHFHINYSSWINVLSFRKSHLQKRSTSSLVFKSTNYFYLCHTPHCSPPLDSISLSLSLTMYNSCLYATHWAQPIGSLAHSALSWIRARLALYRVCSYSRRPSFLPLPARGLLKLQVYPSRAEVVRVHAEPFWK